MLLILPLYAQNCFAGGGTFPLGARSAGMANASVTLRDPWAVFNNIGGLSSVEYLSFIGAYQLNYGLTGLSYLGAAVVLPTPFGNASFSVDRFGDKLYSEQKIGIGYSNKLGIVSLGIKINYLQYHLNDLGTRGVFVLELGGVAEITPHLFFGAHIFNINQAKLIDYNDERVPVIIKAGLSYRPISKLMFNIEAEKDIDYDAIFKAGIEYEIIKTVKVRTGISTSPSITYFGLGFAPGKINVDYALSRHPMLGFSHQLSVAYRLKK